MGLIHRFVCVFSIVNLSSSSCSSALSIWQAWLRPLAPFALHLDHLAKSLCCMTVLLSALPHKANRQKGGGGVMGSPKGWVGMRLRQINLFSETHLRDKKKEKSWSNSTFGGSEWKGRLYVEKNIAIQSTTMKQALGDSVYDVHSQRIALIVLKTSQSMMSWCCGSLFTCMCVFVKERKKKKERRKKEKKRRRKKEERKKGK